MLRSLGYTPLLRPLRLPVLLPRRLPLYRQAPEAPVGAIRWQSTSSVEEEGSIPKEKDRGHIAKSETESLAFFDNLFPLKLSYILRGPWRNETQFIRSFETTTMGFNDPVHTIKRATEDLPLKITEIVPRVKDGGAFVKFSYNEEVPLSEIESKLSKVLEDKALKPWFNPFARVTAGIVHGIPWLEDLNRFPKTRLRIEFVPREAGESVEELYQETLYSLFRQYGRIAEIISQPADSKVAPRFAYVDFMLVRDAIMARNCMHGFVVGESLGGGKNGTRLRISYEKKLKPHSIWNWLTSHPRLVIPVVAAMLAALTVVIFDPIRKFFVKNYVKHKNSLTSNRFIGWIKTQTDTLLGSKKKDKRLSLSAFWNQRQGLIEDIESGLTDPQGTFIVVQGSKGSGRDELVEQALKDRKYVLTLDCKAISESNGETGVIRKLAATVGYRPIFSWANSMSSMIDLAVQSTTGVKAGFSETFDAQLSKILHTTASAIKEVSLSARPDKSAETEDAFLESHPQNRTVVVIDNFLYTSEENKSRSNVIYDKISEFAATLVQNNIAHVIFLTNDSSFSKVLGRVLPDRSFRHVSLGDLPHDVAKKYILSRLEEDDREERKKAEKEGEKVQTNPKPDIAELSGSVEVIGGRLADLELFATRLKSGQTPSQAVEEIVNQSASEIVKNFIVREESSGDDKPAWTVEQAWWVIKTIAERKVLSYDEALVSAPFSAGPSSAGKALDSLAATDLVSLKSRRGFPVSIEAGKPTYQAAFKLLAHDAALRSRMDRAVLSSLAKAEKAKIEGAEKELAVISALPKVGSEVAGRVNYLLANLADSQRKIVEYEAEIARLKKRGASKHGEDEESNRRWWKFW
ncbi:hypothetical protein jhhlp_006857 [Lomentospora prolificans]|uniref:Mitochondrial escape protein 2 n=1 Tax=Lomentospora prolificans TaxID=41688 RepID=A0A2N3N2Y7_9PEZI|nr:hypothetical protein jhhlp_006857 [Lomentospora prolificans]